ncbi:hypothetical protein CANTEDRAFT_112373 [Yamadazyma tenuis ATCC 10573]|uniref:Long chronological lifespan protein 2 n=1 Tax=Candida tenuis (strain ATCC 10573 / BCRC 21748 / CBS 615 / JCM 9827 / NBRC 10315 / NRRL Y-1498 / VKM Y-70) TaxID=590646 RepID=G3AX02_CANTC|nr:uncharacterized protein CANTEDRAFT_112373 [Yamadazyma tenuis ATCC 10573]XP_006684127.1 uncharacterized protein CANTEDRAFT_112373 [Yamadazyma tenuis ATCC 10573]EGV66868.1 hypothetical protein CANTEDRAFT_112373 [Yamadazyma tenuis ATCC 10573]EGV66869.1 hypothetical protein CANTEDRAFT_112373 [Yamadazyma tenuis ATCC 10573]
MLSWILTTLTLVLVVQANFFDFVQNQFHTNNQGAPAPAGTFEMGVLNSNCKDYLCPETQTCVQGPRSCPCPFPSSQLRCVLPDGNYICISKPAGDFSVRYKDPQTNWKIDANDDTIRDCGWVNRHYRK